MLANGMYKITVCYVAQTPELAEASDAYIRSLSQRGESINAELKSKSNSTSTRRV